MKKLRLVAAGSVVVVLLSAGLAQKAAQHLLSADELKKAVPTEFFFRGQKAPNAIAQCRGISDCGRQDDDRRTGRRFGIFDRGTAEIPRDADYGIEAEYWRF